jgi:hypothetical protein
MRSPSAPHAKAAAVILSGAMQIDYHGVKPPDLDTPLIELETDDDGVVDLYNDCRLRAATFDAEGLTFDFAAADGATIRLQFRGLERLRVEQPPDWVPQEAGQIDHLLIRREGPWPCFEFKAGGLRYEFDAAVVALARSLPSL